MTPQFEDIEVTVLATVSFEVFCHCGEGLCNQSTTRSSRRRGEAQVVVDACEKCLKAARNELEEKIGELQQLLDETREELESVLAENCHL